MKYIQLNNTDLNISSICLGTAGFGDKSDLEKSFEILNAFVRAGGNFIDTANVYCKWLKGHGNCSEQIIGKWLKESGMQAKVIVATKGAHYSFEDPSRSRVNKEDIRMDLDESCRTLGKDEMDFYWLHRDDPEKPICAIKTWKNISASFIFAGGDPLVLFEGTDKIAQIIKAIPIGNLCDGIIGGSQLAAGLLDPLAVEVIHWCLMRHLGKEPAEIFGRHGNRSG